MSGRRRGRRCVRCRSRALVAVGTAAVEKLAVVAVPAGTGPLEEAAHRHSPVAGVVRKRARVPELALALMEIAMFGGVRRGGR